MTCPNCDHPRATLMDGSETCTWSEAWRAECEARHVCNMPTLKVRREYLAFVQAKRGENAWLQLRDLIAAAWNSKQGRPAGGGG